MEKRSGISDSIMKHIDWDTQNNTAVILSKSDQVYNQIKDLILHYELKAGDKISEDDMATMLQASRTPVRDAFKKLAGDGLITIYPKRFAEVTFFTRETIQELGFMRMDCDILSGRLAIYRGSNADFAQLRELADKCEAAQNLGDIYGRIIADRDFHLRVTEIGGNRILLEHQKEIYQRLHLVQLQYDYSSSTERRIENHNEIIYALTNRDEQAYVRTICKRCEEMYDIDPYLMAFFSK